MRVGQNPAKFIESVPQPQRVTVAVVVYIPFLNGYYTEGLDVLKVCLESLWQSTSLPYDLLVFDNASCIEVRDYLVEARRQGRIQYLVLSDRNVGKGGAWNFIFQGAPGEVIAYADSDVSFSPGWLERSLEILDTFPRVGMVSARPLRTPERFYTATLEWAAQTPEATLDKGQFTPWEMFKEHNDSLGVALEMAQEWYRDSQDVRVCYGGLTAYVGAAHFQFVARKDVLRAFLPFKMDRPMGQVRSLDQQLNEAGYLRLTTSQALVKHLGNSLLVENSAGSPLRQSAKSADVKNTGSTRSPSPWRKRFANLPPVRRSLLWLYDRIFRLYFSN